MEDKPRTGNHHGLPHVVSLMARVLIGLTVGGVVLAACTPATEFARPSATLASPVERVDPWHASHDSHPSASQDSTDIAKVRCRPPTPTSSDTLTIYLLHKTATVFGRAVPVKRAVPPEAHAAPLRAVLEQLTRGTTPRERRAGCISYFNSTKKNVLLGVALQDDLATINLRGDAMFALGATAATSAFYKQLIKTVFQFPNIDAIRLELDGSCEAFGEAVQSLRCHVITRD